MSIFPFRVCSCLLECVRHRRRTSTRSGLSFLFVLAFEILVAVFCMTVYVALCVLFLFVCRLHCCVRNIPKRVRSPSPLPVCHDSQWTDLHLLFCSSLPGGLGNRWQRLCVMACDLNVEFSVPVSAMFIIMCVRVLPH